MLPRGIECIAELITRIRDFVCSKHCTQTTFVKTRIMCNKGHFAILNVREICMNLFLQLGPYIRKEVGIVRVAVTQAMHLLAEPCIVVRHRLYQRIEGINYFFVTMCGMRFNGAKVMLFFKYTRKIARIFIFFQIELKILASRAGV